MAATKPLTKETKLATLKWMGHSDLKDIVKNIVLGIDEGRELGMTSSEILDGICDTLREHNLND